MKKPRINNFSDWPPTKERFLIVRKRNIRVTGGETSKKTWGTPFTHFILKDTFYNALRNTIHL